MRNWKGLVRLVSCNTHTTTCWDNAVVFVESDMHLNTIINSVYSLIL